MPGRNNQDSESPRVAAQREETGQLAWGSDWKATLERRSVFGKNI